MNQYTPNVPFRHILPVQIRFNDVDMFGHLNNSVYLQFMDMGKYAYFRQFMEGGFGSGGTAPVVANINCNFHAPAYMDEKLEVRTAMAKIGDSSLVLEQCICTPEGSVKCSATTIMVNINLKTQQPETVDNEWRSKLSEYEGREL